MLRICDGNYDCIDAADERDCGQFQSRSEIHYQDQRSIVNTNMIMAIINTNMIMVIINTNMIMTIINTNIMIIIQPAQLCVLPTSGNVREAPVSRLPPGTL